MADGTAYVTLTGKGKREVYRIFIVEDDPVIARAVQRDLEGWGYQVACAARFNDVLSEFAAYDPQLVLLDSDFAAMPKVVAEGRRVINNIQRASALYLVKNILSFFLALITLFAAFPYPFVPIQLTLISALTIGVPSFFLALEPNHDLVKGKFLHNVLRRAFPGGLTAIFVILFAELFVYTFDLTLAELSTICVILMAVNGLMVIYYAAGGHECGHVRGGGVLWGVLLSLLPVLCSLAGADRAGAAGGAHPDGPGVVL